MGDNMWKCERSRRALLKIGLIFLRGFSLSDLLKTELKKGFALFLASKTDNMFDRQIYFFLSELLNGVAHITDE